MKLFMMRYFPVGLTPMIVGSILYCVDGLLGWPFEQEWAQYSFLATIVISAFGRGAHHRYCERKGIVLGRRLETFSYVLGTVFALGIYFLPRFLE